MRKLVCGLLRPPRAVNLFFGFVLVPLSVEVVVFEFVGIPLSVEVIEVGVWLSALSL